MLYRLLLVSTFLLINISLDGQSTLRTGQDYALFFANDNYQNNPDFGNLKNPVRDAKAIEKELQEMYGFKPKVYENLDQPAIFRILEQWQKRSFGKDDQLFIFFSGHGTFRELTKKGYFVPQSKQNDYSAYIELTDLGNIITQIPCRHILLAVDACFSGTIDQEIAFKGDFQRPNETQNTGRTNLLYRQLRNQSRLLITSGGKQRTPDGKDHSPFAEAIIKKLKASYTNGDGLCTFQDMLSQLERISPTPHQGELPGHEQGGFVFVARDMVPPQSELDDMVFIQGGTFEMGDVFGDGYDREKPTHSVTVGDFFMGRHEVTFEEYDIFCDATKQRKPSDDGWGRGQRPIINVSWHDAVAYCNWRSEQESLQKVYTISGNTITANWSANGYRLPTEAEWEYAARSRGKKEKWAGSSEERKLMSYANGAGELDGHKNTSPIGSFRANDLGLYDMSGNVWEWCWDWYEKYYSTTQTDPRGPSSGSNRVLRGGSMYGSPASLRCANRDISSPGGRSNYYGFRLSMSVE